MAHDKAYRKAERKIEEALGSGATELDLSCGYRAKDSEKLTELPVSLAALTQLQTLNLSNNRLTALPESLTPLTQLQTLNLSGNQLTALPESLGQLTQLQTLDLTGNQLTALSESLGQLTQLRSLNLSENQLTALPDSLGQLTQLQTLNLYTNRLATLPESLCNLTQLRELLLPMNHLTCVPSQIGNLRKLSVLSLSSNAITSLPESMGELSTLKTLGISNVQLKTLPSLLWQLVDLTVLSIASNELTEIPDSIAKLQNLSDLFLGKYERIRTKAFEYGQRYETRNCLVDIPTSLVKLGRLKILSLEDNPLNPELAAVYKDGLDAVKAYLRAKAEDEIVLNEAKLILIGEGEVGKTSLLGALRGDEWVENRPTTHGVEVAIKSLVLDVPDHSTLPPGGSRGTSGEGTYDTSENVGGAVEAQPSPGLRARPSRREGYLDGSEPKSITLNGWDFGGQNIYRHTHQLFSPRRRSTWPSGIRGAGRTSVASMNGSRWSSSGPTTIRGRTSGRGSWSWPRTAGRRNGRLTSTSNCCATSSAS